MLNGILVIFSGAVLGQVIGIASMPIITRLYTTSDLGIFVLYSSIISIILSLASFRYEFAIPLPKNDILAGNLLVLSLLIVSISMTIIGVLFVIGGNFLLSAINAPTLIPYTWIIIISFFFSGIYQILNYWVVRRRDYGRIAMTTLSRNISGFSIKLFLGFLSFGPLGLLLGELMSQAIGSGLLAWITWKRDKLIIGDISLKRMKCVAQEYREFPTYGCLASFLNVITLQLPVLALSYIYGPHVTGLYGLAYGVLSLPTSLISGSLSQVYFGEVSKLVRNDPKKLESLYLSTTLKLAKYGTPIVCIISLLAPFLFPIIFGDKWAEAGIYCFPLALGAIPFVIVFPLSNLPTYRFSHWQLAWNLVTIIFILCGFFISYKIGLSPLETLVIYGVQMIIMYIFCFILNVLAIRRLNHNYMSTYS